MAVYVISAICALLAIVAVLVFTVNVKITLKYSTETGNFSAVAGVLFLKFPLYPPKEKKKKSKNKKEKKKTEKTKPSVGKVRKDLDTAASRGRDAAENTPQKEPLSQKAQRVAELIKHIAISLRELAPGVLSALTLDIKQLDICVGAEDAANAAVSYGAICGGVEMLMAVEKQCKKLVVSGSPNVQVDFTFPRIRAAAELVVSVRAYKVLFALYRAEDAYYTHRAGL